MEQPSAADGGVLTFESVECGEQQPGLAVIDIPDIAASLLVTEVTQDGDPVMAIQDLMSPDDMRAALGRTQEYRAALKVESNVSEFPSEGSGR